MVAAYSFGKAQQRKEPQQSPAPGVGNYDPNRAHNNKPPTWKIGTASRNDSHFQRQPGPAQYNQIQKPIKRRFPEYSFGAKCQHEVGRGTTPGPGAYDQDYRPLLKCASSYSMRPRVVPGGIDEHLREVKNGPGPAAYDTNYSTIITRPSSRIGRQERGGFYDEKRFIPGVGNYNVRPGTSGPYHRFGGATRDNQFANNTSTPGPGQYMLQSTLNVKAVTISTKRLPTQADSQPGPGHYEPSMEFTKRSSTFVRVGTAKQRQCFDGNKTPGPGTYQSTDNTKRKAPSYKVGTEKRRIVDNQEVPGPGTYEIDRDLNGKSYTLRPKYTDRIPEETPGPLNYNPSMVQTKSRPASCRVGTESREKNIGNSNPAPNQYQILEQNRGPKYQFGNESRVNEKQSVGPGPGTYNIPPIIANLPSYLLPKGNNYID